MNQEGSAMDEKKDSKPVSGIRAAGVWLLLIAISVTSFFVSYWVMSGNRPVTETRPETPLSCVGVVLFILGGFALTAGIAAYLITLVTNCFTFNFTRPVWNSSLKLRIFIANIIVPTLLLMGLGGGLQGLPDRFMALSPEAPGRQS